MADQKSYATFSNEHAVRKMASELFHGDEVECFRLSLRASDMLLELAEIRKEQRADVAHAVATRLVSDDVRDFGIGICVDGQRIAPERVVIHKAAEPVAQHPDDVAVDAFAAMMKAKLAESRAKGRGGWQDKDDCPQQRLSDMLRAHVAKGDTRDVANFCMFLHARGESILPADPVAQTVAVGEIVPRFTGLSTVTLFDDLPVGTRLYAAQPRAVPDDATEEMTSAARYAIVAIECAGRTFGSLRKHCKLSGMDVENWPAWTVGRDNEHFNKSACAALIWWLMYRAATSPEPSNG
jgi:hypothetical protein